MNKYTIKILLTKILGFILLFSGFFTLICLIYSDINLWKSLIIVIPIAFILGFGLILIIETSETNEEKKK